MGERRRSSQIRLAERIKDLKKDESNVEKVNDGKGDDSKVSREKDFTYDLKREERRRLSSPIRLAEHTKKLKKGTSNVEKLNDGQGDDSKVSREKDFSFTFSI